jgi:membrane-associated phospholipid phosphatase
VIRKFIAFVLRSRLENVMAAGFSLCLVLLFLTTRLVHSFAIWPFDFVFILLPAALLCVGALLKLLAAGADEAAENADPVKYLAAFFGPLVKIFRDWFPFFLLCSCYYALYSNLTEQTKMGTADAILSKMDAAIFGNQVSFLLEPFIRPGLTDFLNTIYFSHLLFFPGVALFFYLRREAAAFRRLMMGFLTIMLMGVTSYILVPAVGPEKFFADHYTRDLHGQMISRGVSYIIDTGRVAYDSFPSLHVGIPLLLSFYLREYCRRAFIPALVYVALMCCATIYLRYHYVVDVIAAFAYAPAAYWLNDWLLRHWPGERIFPPGGNKPPGESQPNPAQMGGNPDDPAIS